MYLALSAMENQIPSDAPLLSAVVIAFNEEANIVRCLDSLQGLVDEVVVVDSGSTDATVALAEAHGAQVLFHPFEGHIEQKNWAWQQSRGRWILSLDADEALDETLRASLAAWRADEGLQAAVDGFICNRLTQYCGHWVRHSGWYPDRKLRLWRRDCGRWGGVNPHDRILMEPGSRVERLAGDLLHYSYGSLADHVRQLGYFSDIAAVAHRAQARGVPGVAFRALKTGFQWIKNFVLRGGWRDGWAGWHIARYSALATWEKYRKIEGLDRIRRAGVDRVRRVVICRTDGLGDVVLSLPIAGWLKAHAPGVHVSLCVAPYAQDVAAACPDVDGVVLWTGDGAVFRGGFDLAVVAFPDKAVVRALVEAGVPVRVGSLRRWHTWRAMTHGVWQSRKRSGRHEAWHGLQLLEPARLAPGLARPGQALPGPGAAAWSRYLRLEATPASASGAGADLLRAGVRHLVIHPGSHGSAGNWELARYRALAGEMRLRGWDVLVTGTARERAGMDDLWSSEGAPLAGHLVDATGRFSVAELMTLLARVDAVVAASTGPLHLAAALGTPVVGLYGGGAPVWPARWHPIGAQARWLVADTVRPDGTLDIPVGEVVEALEAFDSRATEGSMGASATATLRDDR